jgi:hypothetical protein
MPLAVAVLTVVHVILVRRHGVVPPIDAVLPVASRPTAGA